MKTFTTELRSHKIQRERREKKSRKDELKNEKESRESAVLQRNQGRAYSALGAITATNPLWRRQRWRPAPQEGTHMLGAGGGGQQAKEQN